MQAPALKSADWLKPLGRGGERIDCWRQKTAREASAL